MKKLPKIEKIPEAYTAIEDDRIKLYDDYAYVKSSDNKKEYQVKFPFESLRLSLHLYF